MKLISEPTTTPYSILLVGPPGGRKTTLALQFPDVFYVNLDLNEAGPTNKLKELNLLKPFWMETITIDDDGNKVASDQQFDRLQKAIDTAVAHKESKTLVLDSLTTLDAVIYRHVKKKCNRPTVLELQDWRLFRQILVNVFNAFRDSGKNCIILAHEEINTDKQGNVESYTPAVSTRIKDYLGGFFTDVWRSKVRPGAGGKYVHELFTLPTPVSDLKNSWSLPGVVEDPTYAKLLPYIEKNKAA